MDLRNPYRFAAENDTIFPGVSSVNMPYPDIKDMTSVRDYLLMTLKKEGKTKYVFCSGNDFEWHHSHFSDYDCECLGGGRVSANPWGGGDVDLWGEDKKFGSEDRRITVALLARHFIGYKIKAKM